MGIGYSNISTVSINGTSVNASAFNGLLPDVNYTTLTAIEDLPFSRTVPVTETLRGVYVPHDYSLMNLKSPTDSTNCVLPQRLFILVIGNPGNDPAPSFKVTVVMNWEGIPSPAFADILTTSYNDACPTGYEGKDVFDEIIQKGLIVSKEEEIKEYRP
jgi:hypothetical protein